MLHTMVRFNFYLCFFISMLSFYFLSLANRCSLKEAAEASGGKAKYEKSAGVLFLCYILIWNLLAVIVLWVSAVRNDGTEYFLRWFLPNYMVNILVPHFICLLLSFVMAAGKNYYRNMLIEISFLFLISPLAEGFHWREKTAGFPIDVIYQFIRWPFTVLYQNGEWSPDFQNDFQMEPVRLFVSLFWLLLLCGGAAYLAVQKKMVSVVLGLAAVLSLVCSYQPASLYRLNSDWNGTFADYGNYNLFKQDNQFKGEGEQEYTIASYNLKLDFGSELSVDGILQVEAQKKQKKFLFTLYRGFQVNQLEGMEPETDISFRQEEDTVFVACEKPVKELKLHIKYQGHHNKFYANSTGAMLPGWLPWYPMAGTKQVFLEYGEYGKMYGYNPYNRIKKADIQLESNRKILTNLGRSMGKTFKGNSDSITVLGGNFSESTSKDSVVRDILPLQLMKGTSAKKQEKELENDYRTMLSVLEKEYGVDVSDIQVRDIYVASRDLGRNVVNNNLAVFDDYILAVPGYLTANELINYLALEDFENYKKRQESAVIQFFMLYTQFDDGGSGILQDMKEAFALLEENPEEYPKEQEYLQIKEAVRKKADEMGAEAFGKDLVSYLLEPSRYADDQEFLESR